LLLSANVTTSCQSLVNYVASHVNFVRRGRRRRRRRRRRRIRRSRKRKICLSFDNLYKALTFDTFTFTVSDVPGSQHVQHA